MTGWQPRALAGGLVLAAIVIGLDQMTKAWMMGLLLEPPRVVPLTGFMALVPVWNSGVSFGVLASPDASTAWLLGGLAALVALALTVWLARADRTLLAFGLSLVIGGAVGNVIDRARFGRVFDFLDVHVAGWHWPAFNLADSAITIGVGLLLLDGIIVGKPRD